MSKSIQSIRGMHDILPAQTCAWQKLEETVRAVVASYGYSEIRLPILEQSALFRRSIGDVTDIVEKEMYTFTDRNGDCLSLRPEGTAGCVRAGIQHGFLNGQVQRLWYMGTMYRRERPQRGRYREFRQFGAEVYGLEGPDIDVELILIGARLWKLLGVKSVCLEINTLGDADERRLYREQLIAHYQAHSAQLDDDANRRLYTNPMRILDSKNPQVQAVNASAPELSACLGDSSRAYFDQLQALLTELGVDYRVNPRLVRGLDYYSHTVFEWVSESLGAQGTICAGGRYDNLVPQLGGRSVPAVGFAMGLDRILALLESRPEWQLTARVDIYLLGLGDCDQSAALALAEMLRDQFGSALNMTVHCGGGSLKSRFKKADRLGAGCCIVVGGEEGERGEVLLKFMGTGEQRAVSRSVLLAEVEKLLRRHA